jgi:drug/metabolite transporter (DMT)-like permease
LIIIIGLIGNFIPFFLISWSEQYIQSNTAGLLLSVAPIFALLLSHFFTKDDKFTLLKFISIIVGLIGVFFIIGFDTLGSFTSNTQKTLIPKIAIIFSALGYVISSILAYNLKEISTMTLTTLVTVSAALLSVPFMIYIEIYSPSSFNTKSLLSIFYLGLFPTAIAFQLRFHIISKAGPIFLSYVAYLIPAFAILWGYLFLNEKINLNTLIGVILILIGVFISQQKYSMDKIT